MLLDSIKSNKTCFPGCRNWLNSFVELDHSLNGKVDELDKATAVAVRDPAWYGLDEVELEKCRRWTSTADYQVKLKIKFGTISLLSFFFYVLDWFKFFCLYYR